jgi:MFS family permease
MTAGAIDRTSLLAVMSVVAIAGVGFGTSMPLLSILLERAGYSGTVIGLNTAIHAIAALAILPLAPRALRRFGPARLLMISLIAIGASLIVMRAVIDLRVWIPMRFVFGASLAIMFTTSEYWVNAIATEETRGRLVGLYATLFSLGWTAGPLLLGVLGTQSWTPLIVTGALLGLSMIPLLVLRRAVPLPPETAPGGVLAVLREAPVAVLAPFVYGAVEFGVFALLPVYALRQGLSASEGAYTLAALSAGAVGLQIPLGWLADRMDRRRLLVLCALAGVLGALSLPAFSHDLPLLYGALAAWGGCVGGLYTVGLTLIGERFKGPRLAAANTAVMLLYSLGGLLAPPISGAAMDRFPSQGLAWVLGLICGSYALFAVRSAVKPGKA